MNETHSQNEFGSYCPITVYPHDKEIGTRIQKQKIGWSEVLFGKVPAFKHKK
jgi:hypothetical protein